MGAADEAGVGIGAAGVWPPGAALVGEVSAGGGMGAAGEVSARIERAAEPGV